MRTRASVGLVVLAVLAVWPVPSALAGNGKVFHAGAHYRKLFLKHPPGYWTGGLLPASLLFEPLAEPTPASPPPRAQPVTRRVPDAYLAAARNATPRGSLWVKTENGFWLERFDEQ